MRKHKPPLYQSDYSMPLLLLVIDFLHKYFSEIHLLIHSCSCKHNYIILKLKDEQEEKC
jgi:hypothetical protein